LVRKILLRQLGCFARVCLAEPVSHALFFPPLTGENQPLSSWQCNNNVNNFESLHHCSAYTYMILHVL
jgi:hypothetical protein